jgi:hypothetical protein
MEDDKVSMDEVEAEGAVSLPNKEVLSLLDVNANVDLGLDLAAPVDLAAAANLNVAAPIEASASANVLSPGAEAVGLAEQQGKIEQGITGSATADAPQHADVAQTSSPGDAVGASADGGAATPIDGGAATPVDGGAAPVHGGAAAPAHDGTAAPADGGATAPADGGQATPADGAQAAPADGAQAAPADGAQAAPADGAQAGPAHDGAAVPSDGTTSPAAGTSNEVGNAATGATTGNADSLLNDGNLLDANVNINADANVAAPVDGAVAANANVAAPVDAAVGANVGSPDAVAEAAAPQEVDIAQNLDHVSADATATQDADVSQK